LRKTAETATGSLPNSRLISKKRARISPIARRDRDIEATKSRIVGELKRLKIKKYFEPPILEPMAVHAKLKGGSVKTVKSFRVLVKIKMMPSRPISCWTAYVSF